MQEKKSKILVTNVNKFQMKDTGMAFTLICIFLSYLLKSNTWLLLGGGLLLLNMINSKAFKFPAMFWFSLSNLLGFVMSKVLLSLIFFLVIFPIGSLRKLFAYTNKNKSNNKIDSLKLFQWKKSNESVFKIKNYVYQSKDLSNPF